MMTQCPNCGSSEIIADLKLLTDDTVSGGMPLFAKLEEPAPEKKPFMWMADEVKIDFHAAVCGACGYTQIYTKDFAELLYIVNIVKYERYFCLVM